MSTRACYDREVRRASIALGLAGAGALLLGLVLPDVRTGTAHALGLLAAGDLAGLREYLRGFGLWAPLVSVALMQVQAVIAPLPSFPLMYANGLLFGTLWGGLLSWASILVSALVCFGLARLFGRPLVERVVSPAALARADRHLARLGPLSLFAARLIPLTSFDLLSYAAGLTPMRLGPFCLATGLGMTPAIFLTAAAADLGWRSPWALVGGTLGIAALAGLVLLVRPRLVRDLPPTPPTPSPTHRGGGGAGPDSFTPSESGASDAPASTRARRCGRSTPPGAGAGRGESGGPGTSPRGG
jgi:uncharacterized membrane protein YdjX (TVP38/TMEM64 family)